MLIPVPNATGGGVGALDVAKVRRAGRPDRLASAVLLPVRLIQTAVPLIQSAAQVVGPRQAPVVVAPTTDVKVEGRSRRASHIERTATSLGRACIAREAGPSPDPTTQVDVGTTGRTSKVGVRGVAAAGEVAATVRLGQYQPLVFDVSTKLELEVVPKGGVLLLAASALAANLVPTTLAGGTVGSQRAAGRPAAHAVLPVRGRLLGHPRKQRSATRSIRVATVIGKGHAGANTAGVQV